LRCRHSTIGPFSAIVVAVLSMVVPLAAKIGSFTVVPNSTVLQRQISARGRCLGWWLGWGIGWGLCLARAARLLGCTPIIRVRRAIVLTVVALGIPLTSILAALAVMPVINIGAAGCISWHRSWLCSGFSCRTTWACWLNCRWLSSWCCGCWRLSSFRITTTAGTTCLICSETAIFKGPSVLCTTCKL
jgi:hypothetical protein